LKIAIKNNRLIEAREQLRLLPKEAAKAIGIGYQTLLSYESLSTSPLAGKNGTEILKPTSRAICDYYALSPDWLWEGDIKRIESASARMVKLDIEEAMHISNALPDVLADKSLIAGSINAVIDQLTEREQRVVRNRYFEDITLSEVAGRENITRERVRQIELKALSKMRHGNISKDLRREYEQRP